MTSALCTYAFACYWLKSIKMTATQSSNCGAMCAQDDGITYYSGAVPAPSVLATAIRDIRNTRAWPSGTIQTCASSWLCF